MSKRIREYNKNGKIIIRVTIITIIANLFLTAIRLIPGIIHDNMMVISDAINSAADAATSLLIIFAVFMSSPKRDRKYNYGRERVESVIVAFFALLLAGVGLFLLYTGIYGIINPRMAQFNWVLVGVTVVGILIKEGMFWYSMYYGKKLKSEMLKADAWNSRTDGWSSIAVLIGLLSALFMDTNILESIAIIVIAFFIVKIAIDIIKPALNQLVDKAADGKTVAQIRKIVRAIDGVESLDLVRTRVFGSTIYVDVEISVDGDITVTDSHKIAQEVQDVLEANPELQIKHCMVHVKPKDFEK